VSGKGLEQILEKIKTEPRSTLVGRYLMLLADLPDEGAKIGRALDLAEGLVESMPDDALRIAHMVHQADRESLRALDVMIACFKTRGRLGKAEVLKLERDKVAAAIEARGGPREQPSLSRRAIFQLSKQEISEGVAGGARGRAAFPAEAAGAPSEASRIAEIDLGAGEVEVVEDQLDFLFPKEGEVPGLGAAPSPAVSVERIRANIDAGARGGKDQRPGDTIFPGARVGAGPAPVVAQTPRLDELDLSPFGEAASPPSAGHAAAPARSPAPRAEPQGGAIPRAPSAIVPPPEAHTRAYVSPPASRRVYEPPTPAAHVDSRSRDRDVPPSGTAPARDLFDHYWRQGFADEARTLLERVAATSSHESWWQARKALVEQAGAALAAHRPEPHRDGGAASPAKGATQASDDFWRGVQTELGRLARHGLKAPAGGPSAAPHAKGAAPVRLPKETLATIAAALLDRDAEVVAKAKGLVWDLCQGLWGETQDAECVHTLEHLALTRASVGFWGLYLDALIASGRARRALAEVQAHLGVAKSLDFAVVAWRRLPVIWDALGMRGFAWREEDGVGALIVRLSERPRPKLAALLASSRPRSA
jgi:hypothetical protein